AAPEARRRSEEAAVAEDGAQRGLHARRERRQRRQRREDRMNIQPLARRLFMLAVASVLLAVATAFTLAKLDTTERFEPRALNYVLDRVASTLDDPAARDAEVKRLHDATDVLLVMRDADGNVVA